MNLTILDCLINQSFKILKQNINLVDKILSTPCSFYSSKDMSPKFNDKR